MKRTRSRSRSRCETRQLDQLRICEHQYWISFISFTGFEINVSGIEGPVYIAIDDNNLNRVEEIFSQTSDGLEQRDNATGMTPLAFACIINDLFVLPRRLFRFISDRYAIVQYLIQRGADVNCTVRANFGFHHENVRPVHLAAWQNNERLVQLLIKSGSEVNVKTTPLGLTPLHIATSLNFPSTCEILVRSGANINEVDVDGNSPLIVACALGYKAIANFFLDQERIDIHLFNYRRWNALHVACLNSCKKIIERLIRMGANVNLPTREGYTALDLTVSLSRESESILLRDCGGVRSPNFSPLLPNMTPIFGKISSLHVAARFCDLNAMKKLRDRGYDVNMMDALGRTPLVWAVKEKKIRAVTFLLECKADPNGGPSYDAPLKIAASAGYEDIVGALIAHGASTDGNFVFDAVRVQDQSLLSHPHYFEAKIIIIKMLLQRNAPFDMVDDNGQTPLQFATTMHLLPFKRLLEPQHGLFSAVQNSNLTLLKKCITNGAILDCRSVKFRSPLQYAVMKGNYDAVDCLLSAGACPNYSPVGGVTALHFAAQFDQTQIARRLLQSGAVVDVRTDKSKRTPGEMCTESSSTGRLLRWVEEAFRLVAEDPTMKSITDLVQVVNRARTRGRLMKLEGSEGNGSGQKD